MFQERAHYMLKIADVWDKRAPDFVAAAQAEGGGWFGKGMFEAGYVPEVFRAAAGVLLQIHRRGAAVGAWQGLDRGALCRWA